MTTGYALYYKDPEGFDEPLCKLGLITIYPNVHRAERALKELFAEIDNDLNPIKEFRTVKKGLFGTKTVEEIPKLQLPEYVRTHMIRVKKTAFVKAVKMY